MFVEPENLEIIKNIIKKHAPDLEVWAFGSRVHGKYLRKFSDLDLAIISKESISSEIISSLKEDFIESYLPFKVDVLDFSSTSENFQKIIQQNYEIIQAPKN